MNAGELFGRHQHVDEIGHVYPVIKRDILFESPANIARVFSDHCQPSSRAFNQIRFGIVAHQRPEGSSARRPGEVNDVGRCRGPRAPHLCLQGLIHSAELF